MKGITRTLRLGVILGLFVLAAGCDKPLPNQPDDLVGEEVLALGARDPVDDATTAFVDLTGIFVYMHEHSVRVRINVRYLPEEFLYNKPGLPVGHVEYLWQVFFDLNGKPSFAGDVILSLSNVIEVWAEADRAPLLDFTLAEMWLCDSTGTEQIFCGNPVVFAEGNSIVLEVPKTRSPALAEISSATHFQVVAYFNDGHEECSDWMPDAVGAPGNHEASSQHP